MHQIMIRLMIKHLRVTYSHWSLAQPHKLQLRLLPQINTTNLKSSSQAHEHTHYNASSITAIFTTAMLCMRTQLHRCRTESMATSATAADARREVEQVA